MTVTSTDVWEWMYQPLRNLNQSEAPWPDRRAAFLSDLGLASADDDVTVRALLERLGSMSEDERTALLRDATQLDALAFEYIEKYADAHDELLHVDQDGTAHSVVELNQAAEYDEDEWAAFLAEHGQGWDGLDASWSTFRNGLVTLAGKRGFSSPTTDLLDYVATLPVAQRITELGHYGVYVQPAATAKRSREEAVQDGEPSTKVRRSNRLREPAGPPKLEVVAEYAGADVQKLNEDQDIYFDMTATLSQDPESSYDIKHLYEFRQEVSDEFTDTVGTKRRPWKQDKNFHPPYDSVDAVINTGKHRIEFYDGPGWSQDVKVEAGKWLHSYTVRFRWRVTNKRTGQEWVSPVVTHSMTSQWNNGADSPIVPVPGSLSVDVVFP